MGRRGTEADGLPVQSELEVCFAELRGRVFQGA